MILHTQSIVLLKADYSTFKRNLLPSVHLQIHDTVYLLIPCNFITYTKWFLNPGQELLPRRRGSHLGLILQFGGTS